MKRKYILKMQKWNKTKLTKNQLRIGLKRWDFLQKKKLISSRTNRDIKDRENKFHVVLLVFYKGRSSVIARKGRTWEEAKAKCGLAAPIKSWGIKES